MTKVIWLISDTHFNHENIINYCNRPFSTIKEMDKAIINNWNRLVKENDKVFHLGDFALGLSDKEYKDLVSSLNGGITLIRGNHDRMGKKKLINIGFVNVVEKLKMNKYILTHKPMKSEDIPKGYVNIHGHIHNALSSNFRDTGKHINISIERTNYYPVRLSNPQVFKQL